MIKLNDDEQSALQNLISASAATKPALAPAMKKRLMDLGLVSETNGQLKLNAKGIAIANPAAMKAQASDRRQAIAQKNERARK